ncbi:MAG: 50S ribosomal protein L11 methyltransferase [Deltaproteobacteria bacterium]|nr:50S ribosomal protein L11 methyltransferase [Deltaproteobacteria bacterium]
MNRYQSYQILNCSFRTALALSVERKIFENGVLGLEFQSIDRTSVKLYLKENDSVYNYLKIFQDTSCEILSYDTYSIALPQSAWEHFDPFFLCEGVQIFPETQKKSANPSTLNLFLKPESSFGTGRHPTTQLGATLMKSYLGGRKSLLDIGCGSGILSIYAKKSLVEQVDGVEIDPLALENAQYNAQLNAVEIGLYSTLEQVSDSYEVIVANMQLPTLQFLIPSFKKHTRPKGIWIISGVSLAELSIFESLCPFLERKEILHREEWVGAVFQFIL